jgi:putative Mn2+ efflux pump MntP
MDAFAAALCKGLSLKKIRIKDCLVVGLWFGAFQGLMPLLGFLLGNTFAEKIQSIDHWVAFILLAIIGGNMITESFEKEECDCCGDAAMDAKTMFVMAIATSIDAMAVGVSFAFLQVKIIPAVTFIGVITFICSGLGVKIGSIFGSKYKSKAELAGGIVLILMGTKTLLEGLGIL